MLHRLGGITDCDCFVIDFRSILPSYNFVPYGTPTFENFKRFNSKL